MFERFTDRARRVVVLSQEEARMLYHGYIDTEHILLGLIFEGEGVAAMALESLNISLETVQREVEIIIGRGQAAPSGHISLTPRSKRVLELSLREARRRGDDHIDTEHILLGLIFEGEGVGAQILRRLGVSMQQVRLAVLERSPGGTTERDETSSITPVQNQRLPLFKEREKIVLTLIGFEGLTVRETAETLGVSQDRVREIINAAVQRLTMI